MGDDAGPRVSRLRFAVVSWTPPGSSVAVVGGHAKLGAWNPEKAPTLACSLGSERFASEPDYWWAEVDLPVDDLAALEFKFAQRAPGGKWLWDEGGNRKLQLDACSGTAVLLLPVDQFKEGLGAESDHTGRFYSTVKEKQEMSVRKVSDQIFLGSCPRKMEHIRKFKDLGITVVMNFQAECDAMRNYVAGIGMEENALAIAPLYEEAGIEYVWMPTEDMSSAARAAMLPQASFVMDGLLRKGHKIYVHCNAGVGRSVAAVCGYMYYCVGLSPRQLQHVVARARTVAYFDFKALEVARPRYKAQFGPPDEGLAEQKRLLLEGAGLPME